MAQFIARWNAGYGDMHQVVDAATQDEADHQAYECWKEDVESQADYGATPITAIGLLEIGEDPMDYGLTPTIAECEEYGVDPEDFGYDVNGDGEVR